MIRTIAIKPLDNYPMMVTWDVGRRCNYDCTYCEAAHHNNTSKHRTLDEFKETFEFVKEWTATYNSKRTNPILTNISFTGGEPTANPNFWKFIEYVKSDSPSIQLSLTTNGAWNKKYSKLITNSFMGVTVSYHAEANAVLKQQVIDNILTLAKSDVWLQVNVMLHADYWDETVAVYEMLTSNGIRCNPRPIGDGNIAKKGWFIDSDGTNRRTSHDYNAEQQSWFYKTTGAGKPSTEIANGAQLGRTCCGGRCIEGKVDNEWQPVKLINTEFKDWYCSVDWYFLHIDQETKLVYHHQNCQALHNKKNGPIGSLQDTANLLADLRTRLETPTPIVCTRQRCGCGMCVPKAKTLEDYNAIPR